MTSAKIEQWDILVAGGGNAALCAAMTAAENGAKVVVVEHAPRNLRGGNSRHTRNLRVAHDAPTEVLTDSYPVEEYWQELERVTGGDTNEALARMMLEHSANLTSWMKERGVHFQSALSGTLNLGRTNAFFLGGGKALLNAYYLCAERLGIEVRYETELIDILLEGNRCSSVHLRSTVDGEYEIKPKSVVVATGGFQANEDWLREAWGPVADHFIIRGTPYNKGRPLRLLLDQGVAGIGDPTQGHMVAIDGRSPKFDGGIATRIDCVPFSIVFNKNAQRFYDEGEEFWPKRYASWGRLVAQQPDQIAYAIIDQKSEKLFMPTVFPAKGADTISEVARLAKVDADKLEAMIEQFNKACQSGVFNQDKLDGLSTNGLTIEKTNWARPIDTPPFYLYPLKPGLTFTYLGIKVDKSARVLMVNGEAAANIFAAGEIMAGNILGKGYLAGTGMTIGTVFGILAGKGAARHASHE